MRFRRVVVAALLPAALLFAGCAADRDAAPAVLGTLGPGFVDRGVALIPESTITPRPGSWDGVRPRSGYDVILITTDESDASRILARAITEWASEVRAGIETVHVTDPARFVEAIRAAIERGPDLIVSAGNQLVDPLAAVTPSFLDQRFLVVGAQLAEPTANVTAVSWTGAAFRGEGLGTASSYDGATFTADRASRAIRAGVAAVLHHVTGIVIWLD